MIQQNWGTVDSTKNELIKSPVRKEERLSLCIILLTCSGIKNLFCNIDLRDKQVELDWYTN